MNDSNKFFTFSQHKLAKVLFLFIAFFAGMASSDSTGSKLMNTNALCKPSAVERSILMLRTVLNDIETHYSQTGGGGISQIKQTATDTYRVSIAQEERIDQISYVLSINEACKISIDKKETTAISP